MLSILQRCAALFVMLSIMGSGFQVGNIATCGGQCSADQQVSQLSKSCCGSQVGNCCCQTKTVQKSCCSTTRTTVASCCQSKNAAQTKSTCQSSKQSCASETGICHCGQSPTQPVLPVQPTSNNVDQLKLLCATISWDAFQIDLSAASNFNFQVSVQDQYCLTGQEIRVWNCSWLT
jgi:hypothetical protein